jgi:hypothetical protein
MKTISNITIILFIISLLSIVFGYLTGDEMFIHIFIYGMGIFYLTAIYLFIITKIK